MALQLGAYPQRGSLARSSAAKPCGGGALGAGAQHRPLVLLRGGACGQQPEEGVLGRVVGGGALRVVDAVPAGRVLPAGGGRTGRDGLPVVRSGRRQGRVHGLGIRLGRGLIGGHGHRHTFGSSRCASLRRPGSGARAAQCAVQPPSSTREAPVMKDACGVQR